MPWPITVRRQSTTEVASSSTPPARSACVSQSAVTCSTHRGRGGAASETGVRAVTAMRAR
jgi:hypothetical protein